MVTMEKPILVVFGIILLDTFRRWTRGFTAFIAIADCRRNSLFDARPMILLRDLGGCLIDSRMVLKMNLGGNLHLSVRVGHHFPILQHQSAFNKLIMRRRGTQTRFFLAVGLRRISARLQIILDFIETQLAHGILGWLHQLAAVHERVDGILVATQDARAFDSANSLESKCFPNATRRQIGVKHKVKDGVRVSQLGRPLQITFGQRSADTLTTDTCVYKKSAGADVCAPARIVRLDVEGTQALLFPLAAFLQHLRAANEHHAGKRSKPVVLERINV